MIYNGVRQYELTELSICVDLYVYHISYTVWSIYEVFLYYVCVYIPITYVYIYFI